MRAFGGRNVGAEAAQGPSSTAVADKTCSALMDGVLGESSATCPLPISKQHRAGEGLPAVTSMLALDQVGQRNLVLLAPSRDANLGALHGDYAVLHANLSNGVGKHLFSDTRDADQKRQSKPGQTCAGNRRGLRQ